VYAIAAGAADGLGYENNTRASCVELFFTPGIISLQYTSTVLITRGLSEMTRIGAAYGANPLTFLGLAGVGDLFLTCSSPTSRNYTVGHRLGKGESLETIIKTLGSVAEGVTTVKGVMKLIEGLGIEAPIAAAVSGSSWLPTVR
jgi:glycerol-3-phosphate dehydrogenase